MRRLIVNADDFGLTAGVNRGIIELNAAGLLTSATLMARARATGAAIDAAKNALKSGAGALGVGCHVVLVDGEPVLPPDKIPTLVDRRKGPISAQFPASTTAFLARLFLGRIRADEIEAEARAQIEFLQSSGLRLDHIDTHKHTHMFPTVLRAVLRAARACGIHAVRNPFEPEWAVRATAGAPLARVAQVTFLRWLQPVWQRILAEEKFKTTDGTIAMVGTGVLNAAMLRKLLTNLPEGAWELVTHPGYNDADLDKVRTRLRATRDVERGALAVLKEFRGIELISFADL